MRAIGTFVALLRSMDGLRGYLIEDHTRIERLLTQLCDAVDGADAPELQRVWAEFERDLLRHFETEERQILPLIEPRHPNEAEAIRKDHLRIRNLVAELGVGADLHTLRKDVADQLASALRRHASYEDETLYGWLDEIPPAAREHCVRALLGQGAAHIS